MPAELHPDLLAFFQRGLSLYAGATDAHRWPQVARALAIRALPGPQLAVAVPAESAAALLEGIAATGQIAVVLSQPSTHFTVQIKGRDASIATLDAAHWPELGRNREAFAAEILPYGFDADFTDAWFSVAGNGPDALRVVRFTPTGAWNQTPGPGAGAPMEWLA